MDCVSHRQVTSTAPFQELGTCSVFFPNVYCNLHEGAAGSNPNYDDVGGTEAGETGPWSRFRGDSFEALWRCYLGLGGPGWEALQLELPVGPQSQ